LVLTHAGGWGIHVLASPFHSRCSPISTRSGDYRIARRPRGHQARWCIRLHVSTKVDVPPPVARFCLRRKTTMTYVYDSATTGSTG